MNNVKFQTQPDLSLHSKKAALCNALRGALNLCNHISSHANVQDIAGIHYRADGRDSPALLDPKVITEKIRALEEDDDPACASALDLIELTVVVYYHDAVDGVVKIIKELVLDGYELSKDIYIASEGRHACHLVIKTGASGGSELSYAINVKSIMPRFLPIGL